MSLASGLAPMATLKARTALRTGFAIWGPVFFTVAYNFQWSLWGPFNFSGLAVTLLLFLLHAHVIFGDGSSSLHLTKLALFADFLVSIALALGSLIYFVNQSGNTSWAAFSSLCLFMSAFLACFQLANSLEGLLPPRE
jgi:hypothetical protein